MISRFLLAAGLAVLMLVSGIGSYIWLGGRHSQIATPPQLPTAATPSAQAFRLSGTVYLVQDGAIYSLSSGRFHQLTTADGWTMPALYGTNANMVAIRRQFNYSDVFILNRFGKILRRLTTNNGSPRNSDPGAKHWAFYPRVARDGKTLFLSYDQPKYGYEVDMSVWSMPLGGNIKQGRLWTYSNGYTGGDMQPVPLRSGGILYTKYGFGTDTKLGSQVWYSPRAGAYGKPITNESYNCAQPALSPNGRQVAMICTYGKQISRLVIAGFNGSGFTSLKTVISNQMVAQPTWAPDGTGIAYLAPAVGAGPFQLWFLPKAAYSPPAPNPSPSPVEGSPSSSASPTASPTPVPVTPIQVTTNLGFDATSPIAWAP